MWNLGLILGVAWSFSLMSSGHARATRVRGHVCPMCPKCVLEACPGTSMSCVLCVLTLLWVFPSHWEWQDKLKCVKRFFADGSPKCQWEMVPRGSYLGADNNQRVWFSPQLARAMFFHQITRVIQPTARSRDYCQYYPNRIHTKF